MDKCEHCKRELPEGMTTPMAVSGGYTPSICGVCALHLSNKHLGIERSEFQGETAEYMRQTALEHYEKTNQKFDYD
jgi:hypothetical protein